MTQNWEFLFGYTNLVVNGMIILVIILDYAVYKFRELQEAELAEQDNRLLLLSTQDLCHRFSLDQMQRATSNFDDELVIGKGGFGNVYKGTFKVGPTVVAIKRLHSRSSQGPLEFRTEIEMLSKIRHSHLVSLIGYCNDGYEMILIYEFMPGGTLADHLYKRVRQGDKSRPTLSWVQRLKVCIGAARGLDYLHTGTGIQNRIIHRDVKTTNILLDENLEAKISDFGLSKVSPANQTTTDVSTHVKGTFGYLDPYYFSTHRLTRKSDVYSFGVVLFEVLCGRPAVDKTLDGEQMGLAGWAQHCFSEGLLGNIIDPKIKEEASPDCLEAFVKVAIQCLQFGPKQRPNMSEVVVALESALVLQEKFNDYILPEIIISDDHQDVEAADSKELTVGVSKGRHQEKQSSIKMSFTERFISYRNLFWPKIVMHKFLKISAKDSDYSADTEDDEDDYATDTEFDTVGALPRSRRRKSETFRAQYINSKDIKIRAGTWNVGGKLPPDHLEIEDWLNISDPADMYVIGFQEIIPLNAGNIFGAEDNRPVPKWENIIRETLDKIQTGKPKYKSYSDAPSPSRFKPSADAPDLEDEILLETDSNGEVDGEEEIAPLNEEPNIDEVNDGPVTGLTWSGNGEASFPASDTNLGISLDQKLQRQFSSSKKLDRSNCFRTEDSEFDAEASVPLLNRRLARTISGTERMGLSWPEPPLDLLAQCVPERPDSVRSFKSFKSFKSSKSFKTPNSFKLSMNVDQRVQPELASLSEIDLESLINRKRKSQYVRIVSKQMVGLFLTIWVRRSLRRHIHNVNVSTVGVGVMGYIGNKGSISVSMSIFQTLFCFICTHLTSGEKEAEAIKRNADVHEIHRRTHFYSFSSIRFPKSIHDHERIIWLGDLNYRISLPYETTQQLISKKDWSNLLECDQLIRELRKGRTFDGWFEGTLNFPPTYKYEVNSEKYYGEDPKVGRRTPAWCDRILSYGKGIKLTSYRRTELLMSHHRPVSATYMVEVEVFSSKKLQEGPNIH